MELVPLKIKILRKVGAKGETENKYPDFNQFPGPLRGNQDWASYVERFGGWNYDKLSGFGEVDEYNNDPECQLACLLVPEEFALEAVKQFGDVCEIITASDFESFYDSRVHSKDQSELINADVLNGIRAKYGIEGKIEATDEMTEDEKNALNPDHPAGGIVKNIRKKWKDLEARKGIVVKTLPKSKRKTS